MFYKLITNDLIEFIIAGKGVTVHHMSLVLRKPAFCICENKDADQLRGDREADQRLCFRYTDSTIPLLPIPEISSLYAFSVTAQPVCVGPGRKPRRPVFSERDSYYPVDNTGLGFYL